MTDSSSELQQALKEFVRASTTRDQAQVGAALSRLLVVQEKLADATLDPQLRHYLEQRSYLKALTFLKGGDPEQGSCGG